MEIRKCDMTKPYIFVSYSSMDKELVQDDVRKLQRLGYNVWLDDANLDKTKGSWKSDALAAIEDIYCQLVVFYVSDASLTSEPCLNELRKTKDKETLIYHGNESVPFIAVEAERIENIIAFQNEINKEIYAAKEMKKDVKKQKMKVLSEFIEEFFNNNNERVRIHAKAAQKDENEYLKEIIKCFPEETKNQNGSEEICESIDSKKEESDELVTENEHGIREKEAISEVEDIKEPEKWENVKSKKPSSLTGDITYSLYGETYTENQSDMMLRFFAQVLKRHQNIVAELPAYKGMNCVSNVNYHDFDKKEEIPSYFNTCQYFTYENGSSICVGTSYGLTDKLKKMSLLLNIVGEDREVFVSEQVELPVVKGNVQKGISTKKGGGSDVNFEVFGQNYTANQVDMLGIVFSRLIEKHPEYLKELADACTCLDIVDYSVVDKENRPCYFRSSLNVYEVNGVKYSVGGGFSMKDKLKMIGILVSVCEEAAGSVKVEGEPVEVKKAVSKKAKQEKSFL